MKTTIILSNVEQIKSAFNALVLALPKNYYVDSNNLQFETSDNAQTSYYDPTNNKIVISFNNVLEALQKMNNNELGIDAFDKIVRGLVYHELSHAFLTPLNLYDNVQYELSYASFATTDVINIVEDFRIETTLENYYMNTDFNANRRLILNAPNDLEMLSDFTAYVFGILRCDKIDTNANKYISHFKIRACKINKTDNLIESQTALLIDNLHKLFMSYQNNKQQQLPNKQQKNGADTSDDINDAKNSSNNAQQNNPKTFESEQPQDAQPLNNEERKQIKKALSDHLQEKRYNKNGGSIRSRKDRYKLAYVDSALVATLSAIIGRAQGFGSADAYKSFGYSGGFDTRGYIRDMQRKDETFKRFSNKSGDNVRDKKQTKILNILLDNSSSFSNNDRKTSIILKTLARIEKITAFKFNLYIFSYDIHKIERDDERASYSTTCTIAFRENDYTRLLKEMTQEKTIFLVDGSYYTGAQVEKNLKALDSKNTFIISDYANETTLNKMRLSKIVLTDAYVDELEKNIVRAFKALFN